ncbi:MAG: fibronectin type III-like domain-contianing protein, partial [Clostridia bacterium]|nr:fibronectin type III-like domain-contianing protein [Clostridia bacterium]
VDGDEVVQVYVSGNNDKADRPVKLLKGFKRVSVGAGETVAADITLDVDDIKFFNPDKELWELDNSYDVFVGNSSRNVTKVGTLEF